MVEAVRSRHSREQKTAAEERSVRARDDGIQMPQVLQRDSLPVAAPARGVDGVAALMLMLLRPLSRARFSRRLAS